MIEQAGYIVADNEGIIHGYGITVDEAWADTESTMESARITLLDDDEDSSEQHGSWTRRSGLKVWPSTQALINQVETRGGGIGWTHSCGVACVQDEVED